jgi:predicted nucleic acid-binding Zn ribbon protein
MIYLYTCHTCDTEWEEDMPMADRDKPVGQPCPIEGCNGKIARGITAPGLSFSGSVSAIKKAGTGWNDVLKGIKKASDPKRCTIRHD